MIKKLIFISSAAILLSACSHGGAPTATPQAAPAQSGQETGATNSIEMKDFKFSPTSITVKPGQTMTVTNKDLAGHSYTSEDGGFDTGVLSQGQSKTITAPAKPGTYNVHCVPHPSIAGTIVVE